MSEDQDTEFKDIFVCDIAGDHFLNYELRWVPVADKDNEQSRLICFQDDMTNEEKFCRGLSGLGLHCRPVEAK